MIELGMRYQPWMTDAPCAAGYYDPDLWHPSGYGERQTIKAAKMICRRECTVRTQCLALADAIEPPGGPRHGVWGGLDPDERRDRRNKRRNTAA